MTLPLIDRFSFFQNGLLIMFHRLVPTYSEEGENKKCLQRVYFRQLTLFSLFSCLTHSALEGRGPVIYALYLSRQA